MRIEQFVIEGLGHLSTLIADDDAGEAAVVDPRRDVDVYLDAARRRDLRITQVIETHLHNDYVSGGRELAALTGATHVIGAGAELAYGHRSVRHGETVELGSLRFTALDTPGHTPEHVSYAVADTSRADEPVLLLTGGSLLVGAVGRTDLLGAANAVPYAHAMHRSLHGVLLRHEDSVGVFPTHGAGSLCSTGIASTPFSTIGYERRHNRLLAALELDAFARALLAGQPAFPRYFARMRPLNQAGPELLGGTIPAPPPLSAAVVRDALDAGALVVDARSAPAHAIAHVPGSVSIPAGSSFGTWLGWVVDHDRPLVLVLDHPDDADDLVRQVWRIGHGPVLGHLQGGFRSWMNAGLPVESTGRLSVDDLAEALATEGEDDGPVVIDVRQAREFDAGHVPGSLHIGAGDLQDRLAELPRDRPIAVVCASGYRSSVAASLLRGAGFEDVAWVADGVPAWDAAGYDLERGGGDTDAGDLEPLSPIARGAEEPIGPHGH
jgi:hydroxyacylglutathione hydrolase